MSIGMIWLIGSFITLVLWACTFAHDYTTTGKTSIDVEELVIIIVSTVLFPLGIISLVWAFVHVFGNRKLLEVKRK